MLASLGCGFRCLHIRADRTIELRHRYVRDITEQDRSSKQREISTGRVPSHNDGERWVLGKKRCPELRFVLCSLAARGVWAPR